MNASSYACDIKGSLVKVSVIEIIFLLKQFLCSIQQIAEENIIFGGNYSGHGDHKIDSIFSISFRGNF